MPVEITLSRIEVLHKLVNPPTEGDWILAIDPETLDARIVVRKANGYISDILGHEDLFPLPMTIERPDGILEGGDWLTAQIPSIREHDGLYRYYRIKWSDEGGQGYLEKSVDFIHMASEDYNAAKSSSLGYVICFFCQQASEKYLKAFLAYHKQPVPRTHDIGLLVSACSKVDPSFSVLAIYADILNPYGVEIRYIPNKERAKQDHERVWGTLNSMVSFISPKLPRDFIYAHFARQQ